MSLRWCLLCHSKLKTQDPHKELQSCYAYFSEFASHAVKTGRCYLTVKANPIFHAREASTKLSARPGRNGWLSQSRSKEEAGSQAFGSANPGVVLNCGVQAVHSLQTRTRGLPHSLCRLPTSLSCRLQCMHLRMLSTLCQPRLKLIPGQCCRTAEKKAAAGTGQI